MDVPPDLPSFLIRRQLLLWKSVVASFPISREMNNKIHALIRNGTFLK